MVMSKLLYVSTDSFSSVVTDTRVDHVVDKENFEQFLMVEQNVFYGIFNSQLMKIYKQYVMLKKYLKDIISSEVVTGLYSVKIKTVRRESNYSSGDFTVIKFMAMFETQRGVQVSCDEVVIRKDSSILNIATSIIMCLETVIRYTTETSPEERSFSPCAYTPPRPELSQSSRLEQWNIASESWSSPYVQSELNARQPENHALDSSIYGLAMPEEVAEPALTASEPCFADFETTPTVWRTELNSRLRPVEVSHDPIERNRR